MVKVSVVIPIYNVENYLDDCLTSIVNQTLEDIEIICINDGSTDSSLKILEKYAKNDKRITIISQENKGHAAATNVGMGIAKGEYLYLMDSDDIIKLNALEDTYNIAKGKKLDFVIFKAINYKEETKEYYETEVYSMTKLAKRVGANIFNYNDINESDIIFNITVTPWSKLYSREFIERIGAKFPEGLIFDDNVFFWQVFFNAKRIYFHDEFLFTRRRYSASSTTAGDQRFIDSIKIINLVCNEFKKHNLIKKHKNMLYNQKVSLGYMRLTRIKDEFKNEYFEEWKRDALKIINNPNLYIDFFENLDNSNKKIFEQLLISKSGEEFLLLRDLYLLYNSNENLKHNLLRLTNKIKKIS